MNFKKIISGQNKVQILDRGFRMQRNKGPTGPLQTTYYDCVERCKGCKATLATMGDLDGDLSLKYHRIDQHNHRPDHSANIVSSSLADFRQTVKSNPGEILKQAIHEFSPLISFEVLIF